MIGRRQQIGSVCATCAHLVADVDIIDTPEGPVCSPECVPSSALLESADAS